MPKPTIGLITRKANPKPIPGTVAARPEPSGLPKLSAAPQKQEDPDVRAAKAAVENFEVQRRVLKEMQEDWEDNYPEANQARQDVLRQEDIVTKAIADAKPLIAKVKQSIGDFAAQRKYSAPHYDEEEVTKVLSSLENRLEVFDAMLSSGIVSAIGLNREASLAWFAQRPDYASAFQTAFKDREEQTCAVTVPKI
jgi:hypothetical protein